MDKLDELCKEYNMTEPNKVFGFSYYQEKSRYRLFIDYEALLEASK